MVKAILEGRKTQTRRVVKWPDWVTAQDQEKLIHQTPPTGLAFYEDGPPVKRFTCPYGQPGDRLWVRETFVIENDDGEYGIEAPTDGSPFNKTTVSDGEGGEQEAIEIPHFRATEPDAEIYSWACIEGDCDHDGDEDECNKTRWKPAIHMPRWASRIDLEVVKIRVERLQDISEEDAKAEGIMMGETPKLEFENLWNAINGAGSWTINHWVWVVEFKRMRP